MLAQIRAPSDAVLSGTGVKGSFTLNADGSFAAESKITADLTTLRSDQGQRDQFISSPTRPAAFRFLCPPPASSASRSRAA